MDVSRRNLIRGIGAAIIAGATPSFLPSLIPEEKGAFLLNSDIQHFTKTFQEMINQILLEK